MMWKIEIEKKYGQGSISNEFDSEDTARRIWAALDTNQVDNAVLIDPQGNVVDTWGT